MLGVAMVQSLATIIRIIYSGSLTMNGAFRPKPDLRPASLYGALQGMEHVESRPITSVGEQREGETMAANGVLATIAELASTKTDLLWAAAISAVVSAAISYWFKRGETRHKAEVDYEYEQRKKLREPIGRYHGRLLTAANSMNYRLWNLYGNHDKGWLDVNGDYEGDHYYFLSSVYRFLNVCSLIRQLETEAILLDARIAEKRDFAFLNYAAALYWVMTDTDLFRGLQYDNFHERDHFFADHLRQYSEVCVHDGVFVDFEEFRSTLCKGEQLNPVFQFFDGLSKDEERLRWDRLVAFHLLLLAFINAFGYRRQYSKDRHFVDVAKQIRNRRILENLASWIPKARSCE